MQKQYLLTEDQKDLQLIVRDFTAKKITPNAAKWDIEGKFPMDTYNKLVQMGLHTMCLPEEFGGLGLDRLTACLINEELGYGDAGFATSVGANIMAYVPLELAGTPEQLQIFGDIVAPGGLAAFCLTEAEGGSDASNCHTTARKIGNEYVINGFKSFITNGAIAGVYIVFAVTDPEEGPAGISAFLVERSREGVSVGAEENKMGIRASNTSEVIFQDVRVPENHLIGPEGRGFGIAMKTLDRTRPAGSAVAVGICQRAINECLAYSNERVVFGRPISKHQAVSFTIADMEIHTVAARQMIHYAANLMDNGVFDSEICAIAKTLAGDAAMKITTDAVQVMGGYGYSRDYPVEKLMRDAKIFQIFEGTNQIQHIVISSALFRKPNTENK